MAVRKVALVGLIGAAVGAAVYAKKRSPEAKATDLAVAQMIASEGKNRVKATIMSHIDGGSDGRADRQSGE